MARLRITIEFNKSKNDDIVLYGRLIQFSNPGTTIKDILKGLLPIDTIASNGGNKAAE